MRKGNFHMIPAQLWLLVITLVFACSPTGQAQGPNTDRRAGDERNRAVGATTPSCTMTDKVDATRLDVGPNVPTFLSGIELKFSMTIRNKCPSGTLALRVPWRFYKGTEILGSGHKTLQAGEQAIVTFNWVAVKGRHEIIGAANVPSEIVEDSGAGTDNNKVRRIVQVEAVPDPTIVAPLLTYVGPKFKVNYTVCNAVRDAWYEPSCTNDRGLGCRPGFAVNVSEGNASQRAFSIDGEGLNPSCPNNFAFSAGVQPGVLLPDFGFGMDGDRPACGSPAKFTLTVEATRDGETRSTSRTFFVNAVVPECPPKPSDFPKPSAPPKP